MKFGSFIELNAWLGDRCGALWDEVRHPKHDQFSVAEMLDNERGHLMLMPEPFDGYVENPAPVGSTCLVVVARNRYSVPCELAGQAVSTRLYPSKMVIVMDDAVVASHERLSDRGQTEYNWEHCIPLIQRKPGALRNGAPFADMPEPLQQLRRALVRDPGGDRVMAQVLAIVPTAGLDAVLVAVELAPESAATALRLSTPPLANTERYDSLRPAPSASTPRRPTARELAVELKQLRMHGMASAGADLVEQGGGGGGGAALESSRWLLEQLLQAETVGADPILTHRGARCWMKPLMSLGRRGSARCRTTAARFGGGTHIGFDKRASLRGCIPVGLRILSPDCHLLS